jgi:23S rRNA pseudouridine1911/1915/1917 synthase
VHPREGDRSEQTVVDEIRDKVEDTDTERPGIVHRLDKDTSGLLIIAKNPKAKAFLQAQFKDRNVKKTYIALVHGHPENDEAIIELPIGRHSRNPMKRAVVGSGKESTSHYKVIKKFNDHSLLEVYPKTGRTHQIRVHLSHLGNPIVGDSVYGRSSQELSRQFLHAHKLEIDLPNGQHKTFTSPLPPDLKAFLPDLT